MKKGTSEKTTPAGKPASDRPFGQGIETQRVTPRAIERRLYQLLKPLLEAQGGLVATLEDVGDEGVYGLAITLRNHQSFDLVIRECRK